MRQNFKNRLDGEVKEFYVHTTEIRGREHFHSDEYEKPTEDYLDLDTTDTPVESSLVEIINYIKL